MSAVCWMAVSSQVSQLTLACRLLHITPNSILCHSVLHEALTGGGTHFSCRSADMLSGTSSDDGEAVVPDIKAGSKMGDTDDIVPLSKVAASRGQMAAPLQVGPLRLGHA